MPVKLTMQKDTGQSIDQDTYTRSPTYLPCHVTHVGELVSVLARLVILTIPEMPSSPVSHTQVG